MAVASVMEVETAAALVGERDDARLVLLVNVDDANFVARFRRYLAMCELVGVILTLHLVDDGGAQMGVRDERECDRDESDCRHEQEMRLRRKNGLKFVSWTGKRIKERSRFYILFFCCVFT